MKKNREKKKKNMLLHSTLTECMLWWVGGSAIAIVSLSDVWKEAELTHMTLNVSCKLEETQTC